MKTIYSIALLSTLVAPVSAHAADAVLQPDIAPVDLNYTTPVDGSYDWSGAYVGATAGVITNKKGRPGVKDFKDGSFTGGIHAGYNHQLDNNFVLGVETDVNYSKTPKAAAISPEYHGTARIRAGYAIGRVLPYVDGGVAVGRLIANDATKSDKRTHLGYTVGVGVEYALTENLATRVSYHYVNFKSRSNYDLGGQLQSLGYKGHTIGAGLSLKF